MKQLITIVVVAELFVALAQQASAGSVTVSAQQALPGTINLTVEGTLDWAHWGLDGSGDPSTTWAFNHKNGANLISDVTVIDGDATGPLEVRVFNEYPDALSWSDGTPTASEGGTTDYLNSEYSDADLGDGFRFTVPAVAGNRTLRVYVGSWRAEGTLTATLSGGDSASGSWVNRTAGNLFGYFTVDFSDAGGETLTVDWIVTSNGEIGNIKLAAATLVTIPEPSTFVLATLGVIGLMGIRRRRNR